MRLNATSDIYQRAATYALSHLRRQTCGAAGGSIISTPARRAAYAYLWLRHKRIFGACHRMRIKRRCAPQNTAPAAARSGGSSLMAYGSAWRKQHQHQRKARHQRWRSFSSSVAHHHGSLPHCAQQSTHNAQSACAPRRAGAKTRMAARSPHSSNAASAAASRISSCRIIKHRQRNGGGDGKCDASSK